MERTGGEGYLYNLPLPCAKYSSSHLRRGNKASPIYKKRLKSHKKSLLNEGYLNQLFIINVQTYQYIREFLELRFQHPL